MTLSLIRAPSKYPRTCYSLVHNARTVESGGATPGACRPSSEEGQAKRAWGQLETRVPPRSFLHKSHGQVRATCQRTWLVNSKSWSCELSHLLWD